jgi:hypothetical protein
VAHKSTEALALFAATAACLVTVGSSAHAASIDCTDAANVPNPVYLSGSTSAKPLVLALAQALGPSISLIYDSKAACDGLTDATGTQSAAGSVLFASATKGYLTCTGATTGGTTAPYPPFYADVGLSDVYASSCMPSIAVGGNGYADWLGAIQAFEIVVPWTSSEYAISADAAYVVFGFAGQQYTVDPWNDPSAIWTRGSTAAAQIIIGDAVGLSASKWLSTLAADAGAGQVLTSNTTMASEIANANSSKPNTTIGILASSASDPLKAPPGTSDAGAATGGIRPLAFQAQHQECSYYADSDLSHFDKINVRQGRYAIWGPMHYVTSVDGGGNPAANPQASNDAVPSSSAAVQAFIQVVTHKNLTDATTPTLQTVVKAEASASFVPDCAMQVQRTSELGAEASYQPNLGCGCYFESLTGGGATLSPYCAACNTDADCGEGGGYPHCNFGFCEAQ